MYYGKYATGSDHTEIDTTAPIRHTEIEYGSGHIAGAANELMASRAAIRPALTVLLAHAQSEIIRIIHACPDPESVSAARLAELQKAVEEVQEWLR